MKTSDPYAEAYAKAARATERCQYHTPTGRRCACVIQDPQSKFCPRHSESPSTDTQTSPTCSPSAPKTSRPPRASTIPSPISFGSSPASTSPLAAPPDSPTSPACSSVPSPPSTSSSPPTNPPTSRSTSLPATTSHRPTLTNPGCPKKTNRRLACLRRALLQSSLLHNNPPLNP
jgi:hypothetical protein